MIKQQDSENFFLGRKALITGAAGGIGKVLVESLRAKGARVAVTDLDTSDLPAEGHFDGNLLNGTFCDELPKEVAGIFGWRLNKVEPKKALGFFNLALSSEISSMSEPKHLRPTFSGFLSLI